jgi:penicillin-binding protein 1C
VGFNDRYTVGVWVGNFNNEGVPALNGADIATPLLFQLFDAIGEKGKTHWLIPPKGIFLREVCTETGLVPGDLCESRRGDHFLPGISRHITCDCRQQIAVNKEETMVYCQSCLPGQGSHYKVFRIYPPALLRYFEENKLHYEALPPHNPVCTRLFEEEGPRIVSPTDQAEYLIEKEEESKLALSAETEAGVKEIYWYLNDRYLGKARAGETFFCLSPAGDVRISCTDDKGRTSHIRIRVKKF